MRARISVFLPILLVTVGAAAASGETWYVPDDFLFINQAVEYASPGDTVIVRCGTYHNCTHLSPDSLLNCVIMKSGIYLRSETREPDCVTIDAWEDGRVIYCEDVDSTTTIEGFTLTGGFARGTPSADRGGGIFCKNSSPRIINCVITGDTAFSGGGIYCDFSSPTITNCTIHGNGARSSGGGISCIHDSPTITGCTISENNATSGGGVSCIIDCSAVITDCTISRNDGATGGGISCEVDCAPTIMDCTISGNTGAYGGGIHCHDNCAPTIRRCTITENSVIMWGGGIYYSMCSPETLTSLTISGNSAAQGGGFYCRECSPVLEKTIIAHSPQGDGVHCHEATGVPTLICCDVFGNAGGDWTGCIEDQEYSNWNICEDPMFCDPAEGDYRLHPSSPCAEPYGCELMGALDAGCHKVWYILENGMGDARTIGAGADSAAATDTVLVAAGTYYEYEIELKSGVTLMSESGPESTIIDAQGQGPVLYCELVDSTASIEGLTIAGGYAWRGGGTYCDQSSPRVTHCCFHDNSAYDTGGGMCCDGYCHPTLTSCTFSDNSAPEGSGVSCRNASSVILESSIITFGEVGEAVFCEGASTATLICCDLYGNGGGDWVGCIADQENENGNFSRDPLYCGRENRDYTIDECSPCAPYNSPEECGLVGALQIGCILASVEETDPAIPQALYLGPAVPNPSNPATEITYGIPRMPGASRVVLTVYDVTGRRICTPVDAIQPARTHRVIWDGRDDNGAPVASGVYFYRISWNGKAETRRMVLLR